MFLGNKKCPDAVIRRQLLDLANTEALYFEYLSNGNDLSSHD